MAHIRQENAFRAVGLLGRILGLVKFGIHPFQLRPAPCVIPQVFDSLPAGNNQKHVLEDNPRRVFQPPPRTGDDNPEDRLRPVHAANEMVDGHNQRGRNQQGPIAIESEKGERPEDMEMRLNPSPADVDKERGKQHLGDSDDMPRHKPPRELPREEDRRNGEHASEDDGKPHMNVNGALRPFPRLRGQQQGRHDSSQPLQNHQGREKTVRAAEDPLPLLLKNLLAVRGECRVRVIIHLKTSRTAGPMS